MRAGFAGKRKQLLNNLSVGLHLAKPETEKLLLAAGIDPTRRAETLTLAEWQTLTDNLSSRL